MENGDKPAYPVQCQYDNGKLDGLRTGEYSGFEIGLSKREMFAMAAMQGLCANPYHAQCQRDIAAQSDGDYCSDPVLAKRAIEIADELLKQLESK